MNREKWMHFLLTALLPAVGSIVVGLAFFQRGIFNTERIGFQFLSFGIIGGLVFASFRYLNKWIAVAVVVVLLVLDEAMLHSGNWGFVWQDILYYVGVCGAVVLFAEYYFPRAVGAMFGRLLTISSLLSIMYAIVAVIFFFIFQANPAIPRFNISQMLYYDLAQGFLVGFGLGLGIEAADYVITKTGRIVESPQS